MYCQANILSWHRKSFKHIKTYSQNVREVVLCEQCDAFLVTEEDNKGAKALKKNGHLLYGLCQKKLSILSIYGILVWKLMPIEWRYW